MEFYLVSLDRFDRFFQLSDRPISRFFLPNDAIFQTKGNPKTITLSQNYGVKVHIDQTTKQLQTCIVDRPLEISLAKGWAI
jgi:hypothetical protein